MKIQKKIFALLLLVLASFFVPEKVSAATYFKYYSKIPSTWTKAGSPYIVDAEITVKEKVTMEPGTVVKMTPVAKIYFGKGAVIKGTEDEKIVFTSIKNDLVAGDSNNDGNNSKPNKNDSHGLSFQDLYSLEMENVEISYMETGIWLSRYTSNYDYFPAEIKLNKITLTDNSRGMFISNTAPVVENSLFSNNTVGLHIGNDLRFNNVASVRNNVIVGNGTGVKTEIFHNYYGSCIFNNGVCFDVRNNWWGNKSGPYYLNNKYPNRNNLNTTGDTLQGDDVIFDPWLGKDPTVEDLGCQVDCFSNVMFLPGIKASRLYKNSLLGEDKLWPPNYFGNDLDNLLLDDNGKSIENIYTRDAIDEVGIPLVGGNIYKTFLEKLSDLKNDNTINDYESFAYDWRQNVEDIAKNGTPYKSEVKSAVEDLIALAESSKSKKVTIVAHSNGGLLAKAIMLELHAKGLEDKVDKIVFVGTPQMGTPLSMLSLLYGYDESSLFGTLISREDSRSLALNMPGAYGLLPSSKYFERMENPFITFESQQTRFKKFMDAYGEKISEQTEFKDFLSGKEGRETPASDEMEKENILNENLIAQANEMHERLDNWTPPADLEVIQIAGWGLDTVSGVKYSEKEKTDCYMADSKIPSCIGIGEYEPIYEPQFTVDGDKVVVAPSALMLSDAANVKRYWVDLFSYADIFTKKRRHKDILEVESTETLIENFIREENTLLPQHITAHRPNPDEYENQKPRLRMSLYSPLDIHLYDEVGNHTGPKKVMIDGQEKAVLEEGIPNSYYYQFGDRKLVGFEEGQNIKVVMDGYALGTYTLKLDEVEVSQDGEKNLSSAIFSNLPTTDNTTVSFEVPETGLDDMTTLKADMDSDGKNDYEIEKSIGDEISLPVTLEMISQNVNHLAKLNFIADSKTQNFLQVKISELIHDKKMIEKMNAKENNNPEENEIKLLNKKIDDLIGFIQGRLSENMAPLAKDLLIKDLESVKL